MLHIYLRDGNLKKSRNNIKTFKKYWADNVKYSQTIRSISFDKLYPSYINYVTTFRQ
jgi:hypothetical protein